MRKTLIVIGGPTASGKSTVAIKLAEYFDTDIINADSRQVYKELEIGVNKPSKQELDDIRHHLVGHVSIHTEYNAGLFEKDALECISKIFNTKEIAILVGGTGLYIKAVLDGIDDFPDVSEESIRKVNTLYLDQGLVGLQNELLSLDPKYAEEVDMHNIRRITRALEVLYTTGKKFSDWRTHQIKNRDFVSIPLFIDEDRKILYNTIDQRVDHMIEAGLEQEAKNLYPFKNLKSLQTVGYAEWFDFFDGKISRSEAIDKIKQHTRNYAKRQWTWWKKLKWKSFHRNEINEILKYIDLYR